jgi:hypothetical protein
MSSPDARIPISALTTREQVCIALRLPCSGTEWLDELLHKALAMDFEKIQYEGVCRTQGGEEALVYDYLPYILEALNRSDS